MQSPKAIVFDLDDTLAESFQPPKQDMIDALRKLLSCVPIAIVSGGGFPRIENQFLEKLADSEYIERLYILPNSAAQCFAWKKGAWSEVYDFELSESEKAKIKEAIKECTAELGIVENNTQFESTIIDRGSQIAFAAVGLNASLEVKSSWDPDRSKRTKLKNALETRMPEFEILIGGMTTIDITRKGINKAYGIEWLSKRFAIAAREMIFVGDALYPGGNDAVVIPSGIQTRAVKNPEETLRVIEELIAVLPPSPIPTDETE